MRRVRFLALLGVLAFLVPGQAQAPPPAPPADATSTVRDWYARFYDRPGSPAEWEVWARKLRAGKEAPEAVLSQLLGSPEFFARAGGTPEGFVRALFLDLAGREPRREEWADWARQVRGDNRNDVALAFLQKNAQTWQPPAEPDKRELLDAILEQTVRLRTEVERLQENAVLELRGQKERDLYASGDEVLQHLRDFRRGLRGGATREQLDDEFGRLDRRVHQLIETGRALAQDRAVLQRDLTRIEEADNQLHYALSSGNTSDDRGREVLRRRAADLVADVQDLQRTADYALAGNRAGGPVRDALGGLAESAERFRRVAEKGEERSRLRREFGEVERAWAAVADGLNRLAPFEGNRYLRGRAQQVDADLDHVHRILDMDTDRPRILMQLDRPK
jgi:hypothetical protein